MFIALQNIKPNHLILQKPISNHLIFQLFLGKLLFEKITNNLDNLFFLLS